MIYDRNELLNSLLYHAANPGVACGNATLTLSASSQGLLQTTIPIGTKYALLQLVQVGETGGIDLMRYWQDGSAPTTTVGLSRGDKEAWDIYGRENIDRFRGISVDGGLHKVFIQYFK